MKDLRKDYGRDSLIESHLLDNPFELFEQWFKHALDEKILEPNAMILSTIDNNSPQSRTVLLKGLENEKFIFYTNYNSHKGKQLEENSACSILFLWLPLERQVRISGFAEKLPEMASDNYFQSRPRGSQMGAWVSNQSETIESRQDLEKQLQYFETKFSNQEIPRPPHWGGYGVVAQEIEFWQGRTSRLHDRIKYSKNDAGLWIKTRLQP